MVGPDPFDPVQETDQAVVPYFEKPEIDALLAAPDRRTERGRRAYALLLFLYNTGARASEAVGVKVADLDLKPPASKSMARAASSDTAHCGPPPSSSYGHSSQTEPLLDPSSSIAAANPSLASGPIPPSSVMASRSSPKCRRWRQSA